MTSLTRTSHEFCLLLKHPNHASEKCEIFYHLPKRLSGELVFQMERKANLLEEFTSKDGTRRESGLLIS